MPELVQHFEEALENARAFQEINTHRDTRAFQNLDHFFHWYHFPTHGWFAPAKFIGYQGSTVDGYRSHGRHVHDAQEALASWFRRLEPEDPGFSVAQSALAEFLEPLGGHLHQAGGAATGGIYVPK